MPFQTREERLAANAKSAEKNKEKRSERKQARMSRREMKERLQGASSTSERRQIKELYKTPPPQSSAQDVAGYTNSVRSNSDSEAGVDGGGGGGGGTFELDVVKDDNTAGRASFTGGGVIV